MTALFIIANVSLFFEAFRILFPGGHHVILRNTSILELKEQILQMFGLQDGNLFYSLHSLVSTA